MWLLLTHPLLGTWPTPPCMYLDWELNQQTFGLEVSTQSIEPHQPGPNMFQKPFLVLKFSEYKCTCICKSMECINMYLMSFLEMIFPMNLRLENLERETERQRECNMMISECGHCALPALSHRPRSNNDILVLAQQKLSLSVKSQFKAIFHPWTWSSSSNAHKH